MVDINIRKAKGKDAETLAAVYHSAYQENRELGFPAKAESVAPDTVETWIEVDHVYVAENDSKIIGVVRLSETDPERIKLSRLAVDEEWKGNGIGSRLVEHAEQVAHTEDETTVWLTTPEEHPYLPEFYRSRGYEKTGEYPLEYRDYDEIILEKQV
ncbi:Acetyltransferase (GNAT) domain-containing protein [Halovenus aranensis]|uniref:Acetyltransferase (GNAT) domain-containing protein n=1 Tax=Halovenus aranensis TaxID=890420 RepID=A0A1G8SYY5_9EURY|nr:GNAT family N-acetyltransferase [Halovenus aranensis]SDJ34428.1 Acetyltransferase (GNAT) domain-containing protein [Halovenus aranensis]